ncbi:MAG: hypothetical protein PHD37_15585 [Gallionellaceae bacterium]|nr:hypothetical protein [Gallionellaceae bacterium]
MRLADQLDQATGLRRLFATDQAFRAVGILGPDARRNARFTAGMALALGRRGSRSLILDEAAAPHNVGSLLGILTRRTLADGVRAGHLAQAIQSAGQGVELLAAQDGIAALARLDEREVLQLADGWRAEAPQWLLLNSTPGSGQGLSATADLRVLVLPGAKARLAEAYTVMKSAHTVWPGSAWLVVVEGAEAAAGESLFTALRETAQRFLGIQCDFLGTLPRQREGAHSILADADVIGYTQTRTPMAGGSAGRSPEMGIMAERLTSQPVGEALEFEQYWQRMWLYCRMTAEADMKRKAPSAAPRTASPPEGANKNLGRPGVFIKGT